MPAFTPDTPRLSRVYLDHPVTIPAIYQGGHTLTDAEAGWVNTTVATVIGNGFGGYIRRSIEAENKARAAAHAKGHYKGPTVENAKGKPIPAPATEADLSFDPQAVIDELYAKYVLAPGAEKSASDPISKMAATLAEADLVSRLKAKGHSVAALRKTPASTDEHPNKFAELLAGTMVTKGETFRAQAKALLEANTASEDDADEFADLTL